MIHCWQNLPTNVSIMLPCANTCKAREDARHATPVARGTPNCEFAAGCSCYYGHPTSGSPFVQVYLPAGFKFGGKKSRAVCFADKGGAKSGRSATRTEQQALTGLKKWTDEWFSTLSPAERQSLEEATRPAAKKPKK